jgi:hypothetical protein
MRPERIAARLPSARTGQSGFAFLREKRRLREIRALWHRAWAHVRAFLCPCSCRLLDCPGREGGLEQLRRFAPAARCPQRRAVRHLLTGAPSCGEWEGGEVTIGGSREAIQAGAACLAARALGHVP